MFICDAGYISDGVYMGSAPCPRIGSVAKWGTEPLDAAAIRENARTPIRKTQAVWESPSPISPMACIWENAQAPRCIWGVPHAPKTGRCRYSGSRTQSEDASYLGVPKPHISDGVYLGVAQAPRCIWGVPHAPKTGRCRYSGSRTQSRRRKLFGSPQAPYLRWCVFGRMPKPRGVYGEYPMPPRQDAAAIRGNARTQSRRRKLFGSPQAPYLRWCVFGSCPSPKGFMGSTPCPQDKTLPLFGEPNPIFHFSLFIFHF